MIYEKTEQGLSRFHGELPQEVAAAVERADEEAIAAALGDERFAGEYLYRVQAEGRELVGISAEGAFEMARLLGNIEVLPDTRTEKDGTGYYVLVRVRDNLRHVTLLGAARQPLKSRAKPAGMAGEETGVVEHAWAVAVSKAQRNGILRMVSPESRQRIIESFLARERQETQQLAGVATGAEKRSAESDRVPAAQKSTLAQTHPGGPAETGASAAMSAADFAAGCRQKGYRTSAEVCSALGVSDKSALVHCGLARALEKLPDRHMASQISPEDSLDEVDLGF